MSCHWRLVTQLIISRAHLAHCYCMFYCVHLRVSDVHAVPVCPRRTWKRHGQPRNCGGFKLPRAGELMRLSYETRKLSTLTASLVSRLICCEKLSWLLIA